MIDFSKETISVSTEQSKNFMITIPPVVELTQEWCYMSDEMKQEAEQHQYDYHQVCASGGNHLVLCKVEKYNINGVVEYTRRPIKKSEINYVTAW
jgi:hypothetical protein